MYELMQDLNNKSMLFGILIILPGTVCSLADLLHQYYYIFTPLLARLII